MVCVRAVCFKSCGQNYRRARSAARVQQPAQIIPSYADHQEALRCHPDRRLSPCCPGAVLRRVCRICWPASVDLNLASDINSGDNQEKMVVLRELYPDQHSEVNECRRTGKT